MKACRATLTTVLPLALCLSTLLYRGPGHRWARAHAGDALVVAFLFGLLGAMSSWSVRRRLTSVALLATAIECTQLIAGASDRSGAMQLVFGSHFDPFDFAYYGGGLVLGLVLERLAVRCCSRCAIDA